jgi:hypothetical protein
MDMKKLLSISLTLLACSAQANNLCTLQKASAEKIVRIDSVPGFFFKVHPDGNYLSFIEAEHNTLLDLRTSKLFPMVGTIDPVWSPDGEILTHPGRLIGGDLRVEPMRVYSADDVISSTVGEKSNSPTATIIELGGVYQSIGIVDGKYKIVSDQDQLRLGEYSISNGVPKLLTEIYKPCANIPNIGTDLPMISKDGRFLSVYDMDAQTTKIYKLRGKECDLALDVGRPTGKVTFNSDSSQIVFHVDEFSEEFENGYWSGVGKDKVKNVVVLKLNNTKDGKLIPTSWAMASHNNKPGDGSYYPDFDKHGNIYFMEDKDNNFQVAIVSQNNLEFRPMEKDLLFRSENCDDCEKQPETKSAATILAEMWTDVCKNENSMPMAQNREFVMAIDGKACREMVEKFWVPAIKISKDELQAACPHKTFHEPVQIGEWNTKQKIDGETFIKARCVSCHSIVQHAEVPVAITVHTSPTETSIENMTIKKPIAPFDLEHIYSITVQRMIDAIQANKMPKGGSLQGENRTLAINYLQKRLLDLDKKEEADFTNVYKYDEKSLTEVREKSLLSQKPATEQERNKIIYRVNCSFGQKDCDKYISLMTPEFFKDALNLEESKRKKYIDDQIMIIKCDALYEVTPQNCIDWNFKR